MRCFGRHLALLFLMCPILFSADTSFSECVRAEPLYRFWDAPSYFSGNPYVSNLLILQFYSYAFDNSTKSIGLEGIMPLDGNQLLSHVLSGQSSSFSQPASSLTSARASAASASNATSRAHYLSLSSQQATRELIGTEQFALLMSPHPLAIFLPISTFLKIPATISYIVEYPSAYRAALSSAADTYDSANKALLELAKKADEKREALLRAGAGKAHYSGQAKSAFFSAESLLAENSPLRISSFHASEISSYFLSSPSMPDFSQPDFAGYILKTAGNGENSTAVVLAKTYGSLLAAEAQMEAEYQTAHASAQSGVAALSFEVSSLQAQRLDQIGDAPQFLRFEEGANLRAVAGSSFSGINSGLRHAQDVLSRSKSLLSSSESLHRAKGADGYLADAIAQSESASQIASGALDSLSNVRSDAEGAVSYQKESAQTAIFLAEEKTGSPPSSFNDAQAVSEAKRLLDKAKEEFSAAGYASTLGAKFSSYARAAQFAAGAVSALERKESLPLSDAARLSISKLEETITAGEKDGIGLGYEKEKLAEYKKLLQATDSPEALVAIQGAATEDRQNILLSLSSEYASLPQAYKSLSLLLAEIRIEDQSFMPDADSLSQYFDEDGSIRIEQAAGHLRETASKLSAYDLHAQQRLPAHLGWLLSNSARVLEISSPPVLGARQNFSATISAQNPSGFSYNGSTSFSARTSLPLYSAEKTGGDHAADIYPDGGITRIAINGIAAWQALSFSFAKENSPAQITSSSDVCGIASEAEASTVRKISFFAPRSLTSLGIEETVAEGTVVGQAEFLGRSIPLQIRPGGTWEPPALFGSIHDVLQGKNTLELSYKVARPFSVSSGEKAFVNTSAGKQLVTFELSISNSTTDCDSALVEISEPFANITGFSATAHNAYRISQAKATQSAYETRLSFIISPLRKGSTVRIQASYQLEDLENALSIALSQAETEIAYHNSSANMRLLSEAQSLAQQGRNTEALSLLMSLRERMGAEGYAPIEISGFQQENASVSMRIAEASSTLAALLYANATLPAGQISLLLETLRQSSDLASAYFGEGDYKKAIDALRKAEAKFNTDASGLSWDSSEQASKDYAAARKSLSSNAVLQGELEAISAKISLAQRKFAEGDELGSFADSSLASSSISRLLSLAAEEGASALNEAEKIRALFAAQKQEADALLAAYSSQYSVLSGQSKKKLPAPSSFSERISAADKGMASAFKSGVAPPISLQQANQSYGSLLAAKQAVESSLFSLRLSAETSLRVAQAALSEVRQKAGSDFIQERESIESEVAKAEGFLSDSLYSDSLLASDRAIRAANLLLPKAGSPLDFRTIAIAFVSTLFITAAAYYFLRGRHRGEEKEKRGLPKEKEAQ